MQNSKNMLEVLVPRSLLYGKMSRDEARMSSGERINDRWYAVAVRFRTSNEAETDLIGREDGMDRGVAAWGI